MPRTKDTFKVSDEAELLSEAQRKVFHSLVAKLLYMSKRTRLDVLTTASFLCMRVQRATVDDWSKLEHMLGSTYYHRVTTSTDECACICRCSFCITCELKSHTGVVIYVGGYKVYGSSRKQKYMIKSTTEA